MSSFLLFFSFSKSYTYTESRNHARRPSAHLRSSQTSFVQWHCTMKCRRCLAAQAQLLRVRPKLARIETIEGKYQVHVFENLSRTHGRPGGQRLVA